MKNYRRDYRSKKRFAKDIADCTVMERKLMNIYIAYLNSKLDNGKTRYFFIDHGVDNAGEYIDEDKRINTEADFLLRRLGFPDRKIDIKFCRRERPYFHLKVGQMESYIKNDVCIVNFMNIDGDNSRFCILRPRDLQKWLNTGERVNFGPWGGKACIKFPVEKLIWLK